MQQNFVVIQGKSSPLVFNLLALISETIVILQDLTAQGASQKTNLTR